MTAERASSGQMGLRVTWGKLEMTQGVGGLVGEGQAQLCLSQAVVMGWMQGQVGISWRCRYWGRW